MSESTEMFKRLIEDCPVKRSVSDAENAVTYLAKLHEWETVRSEDWRITLRRDGNGDEVSRVLTVHWKDDGSVDWWELKTYPKYKNRNRHYSSEAEGLYEALIEEVDS